MMRAGLTMLLRSICLHRRRYGVEDLPKRRLSRGLCRSAANGEPVRQDLGRELLDVLGSYEIPRPRSGACLGYPDQGDRTSRGGPQGDRRVVARRLGDRDGVCEYLVVDLDRIHESSGLQDLPYLHNGLDLFERTPLDLRAHYPTLGMGLRVSHARREHKSVELSLGQRIRPVELVRVLGRHDEERLGQEPRLALHRHLPFSHCFEQRALRAWGGAVDLIREQDRREDGPRYPPEARLPGIVDARARYVRGQQVGGELDAREVRRDRGRDGLRERRLTDPGYVRKKDVASREERDQAQVDDPVLAHDHLADRPKQPLIDLPNLYRTLYPTTLYGYPSRIRHYCATPHTSSPEATEVNRGVTLLTITLLQ